MKKIILISCVSKKLNHSAKACDLYVSQLFRMNLAYARLQKPDAIFILSAKYGLVELESEIDSYNRTLNSMPVSEIKLWAARVVAKLKIKTDLEKDHFIFLAGERYRKFLIPQIKHYEAPMQGLGIGRQLQFLKRKLT